MNTPAPYTLAQLNGFIAFNDEMFLEHLNHCEECDATHKHQCETMQTIAEVRIRFLKLQEAQREQRGAT